MGLFEDMFGYEKVGRGSKDIILRSTGLNQVHKIKIGRLVTCRTHLKLSHRAKSMVTGSIFDTFDG